MARQYRRTHRATPNELHAAAKARELLDFLDKPTHYLDRCPDARKAGESRIMSHHEFKRNRITCPACLRAYIAEVEALAV